MTITHRSREIFGGFVGRFRHAEWLRKHAFGPDVFLFRNLETGQVLYTQLPFPQVRYRRDSGFQHKDKGNINQFFNIGIQHQETVSKPQLAKQIT